MITIQKRSSCKKISSLFILNCLFTLATATAQAFINVESLRQIDGKGFVGSSGLQISGQEGNTQKFTSQFTTIGVYRLDQNEWLYTANYKYGSSSYLKDTNHARGHIRHTWNYLENLAYEAFLQSEFDEFKQLNSRSYLGANLRFNLIYSDKHRLYAGLGTFYEVEDFTKNGDSEGWRGNIYLSYVNKISEITSGFFILYFQPKFSDVEDYRVRVQTGLDIRLSANLSLDIDLNLSHDTGLPDQVKKTDSDYMVGFSIKY